jgi:DNA helicase HerA-like ATPase
MSASNAGRIGIWGASGSGKSSLAKRMLKGRGRVVVFDPLDEYAAQGMKAVRRGQDMVAGIAANWRGFRLAYVPRAGREAAHLSQMSFTLMKVQAAYKASGGRKGAPLVLVVEEMNLPFPVHGGAEKCPGFAEICSRGRHYGIEVIGLSQRIAEVATRFRGNCTETYVLRQQGPRDVAAAADALGIDKGRVQGLRNLDWLHNKAGEIRAGKVTFGAPANDSRAPRAPRKRA